MDRKRRSWTEEQELYLRQNWQFLSDGEMSRALGKSYKSVVLKRMRLGLSRRDRRLDALKKAEMEIQLRRGNRIDEIVEQIGVGRTTVYNYIQSNGDMRQAFIEGRKKRIINTTI